MKKNLLFLIGNLIASILSFLMPYYLLPAGSYIPKSISWLGFVAPKNPIGWFFVILGLGFLVVAFIYARKLRR
jgi:hypothetical protein